MHTGRERVLEMLRSKSRSSVPAHRAHIVVFQRLWHAPLIRLHPNKANLYHIK
jgi:hypothetical protein